MKLMASVVVAIVLLISQLAYATGATTTNYDEDFYSDRTSTLPQRVTRLEQQLANEKQLALRTQVTNLQKELEQLRGQLEVQTYALEKLKNQQKAFYQDLDQRITQIRRPISTAAKNSTQVEKPTGALTVALSTPVAVVSTTTKKATKAGLRDNLIPVENTNGTEQSRYEAAYQLIKTKQFSDAITVFRKFLQDYPRGHYAANAHYWLGEVLLLEDQEAAATREFKTIFQKFPLSAKVPDARLKLGLIYDRKGEQQRAKQQFERILQQYPDTTSARLAMTHLQRLKQQRP